MSQLDPSERAIHIAARVWCDQEMKDIVMDGRAAMQIAYIIDAVIEKQQNDEPPSVTIPII